MYEALCRLIPLLHVIGQIKRSGVIQSKEVCSFGCLRSICCKTVGFSMESSLRGTISFGGSVDLQSLVPDQHLV